jgi:hypothetical protein
MVPTQLRQRSGSRFWILGLGRPEAVSRSRKGLRLGVETLESRQLLSASSPLGASAASLAHEVNPSNVDLRGYEFGVQEYGVKWGELITITGRVRNEDTATAFTDFRQGFSLSPDNIWGNGNDNYFADYEYTADVVGQTVGDAFTTKVRLPDKAPTTSNSTTWYVGMYTDKDNDIAESNETNNAAGSYGLGRDVDTLAIENPAVSMSTTDSDASEPGTNHGAYQFTRVGSTASALTVHYEILAGQTDDAGPGLDYTLTSHTTTTLTGTIDIPAGQTSVTMEVLPIDDSLPENTETVRVRLLADAGYTLGENNVHTVTIADNEAPGVMIFATDPSASEVGLDPGSFEIRRTGPTTAPMTVYYTIAGTATQGADYQAVGSSNLSYVAMAAGVSSVKVLVNPVPDANTSEGTETVILAIYPNSAYLIGSPSSATINIADGPAGLPQVTVKAYDASASEAGSDPGIFVLQRSYSTAAPLVVQYTLGGTASTGDYGVYPASPGAVIIPAGQVSVQVRITPVDDGLIESAETVTFTLLATSDYTMGAPTTATVNITDNDVAPQPARYDFGTALSPVATDYKKVTNTTAFSTSQGYGWTSGTRRALDRRTGTAMTRDFVYTSDATFETVVPNGAYTVTVYLGDMGKLSRDQMGIYMEGAQVGIVTAPAGQVLSWTYQPTVTDGRLTLRLHDEGGADPYVAIEGLEVTFLSAMNAPSAAASQSSRMATARALGETGSWLSAADDAADSLALRRLGLRR